MLIIPVKEVKHVDDCRLSYLGSGYTLYNIILKHTIFKGKDHPQQELMVSAEAATINQYTWD